MSGIAHSPRAVGVHLTTGLGSATGGGFMASTCASPFLDHATTWLMKSPGIATLASDCLEGAMPRVRRGGVDTMAVARREWYGGGGGGGGGVARACYGLARTAIAEFAFLLEASGHRCTHQTKQSTVA